MRKSVTTKFALFPAYFLLVIFLIGGVAINHAWSQPQTDENVCEGLTGLAQGLCQMYCNGWKCGTDNQIKSDKECYDVLAKYRSKTGNLYPCNDPCANLAAIAECPCHFETVPKTTDCWGACLDCNHDPIFLPCSTVDCNVSVDNCMLAQNKHANTATFRDGLTVQTSKNDDVSQYCKFTNQTYPSCPQQPFIITHLTSAQLATCYCRLTQYANELAQVDDAIVIDSTQSPPYSCGTFTLP